MDLNVTVRNTQLLIITEYDFQRMHDICEA